jgi:hypothetical protein
MSKQGHPHPVEQEIGGYCSRDIKQRVEALVSFALVLVSFQDFGLLFSPRMVLLTRNQHPASSTQQAEQASFTREKIPKCASQFSLKINKRQSS